MTRHIPLEPATADGWPSLAEAMRSARAGGPAPALDVALLPPLVQTRTITLPHLRGAELALVVRREASSYFPVHAAGLVTGVHGVRRGVRTVALVVAAPATLLEAIHGAVHDAGCSVRSVVAAESAWIAAALEGPDAPQGAWRLLVLLDDRVELLELEGAAPTLVRRAPAAAVDAMQLAALLGESGTPLVPLRLLRAARARRLDEPLAACCPEQAAPIPIAASASAEEIAARFAGSVRAPWLVSDDERARQSRTERRRAGILAAAAVVLILTGGVIGALSTHRALARIEATRASIRPQVTRSLARRDSMARAVAQLAAIDAARGASLRWSGVLGALARRLPDDAHLLALRGDGDSLTVEAVATSAASLLAALRGLDGVREVRATSPITQETGAGGALVERFVLTIELAPWNGPTPASLAMTAARSADGGAP